MAAQELVAEALEIPPPEPWSWSWEVEDEDPSLTYSTGGVSGDAWNLWSQGSIAATVTIEMDGVYTISADAWADQAGDELAELAFTLNGLPQASVEVAGFSSGEVEVYATELTLTAGQYTIGVGLQNDDYESETGEDRNLYIDRFGLEGPADLGASTNPLREALVTCEPTTAEPLACAREILGDFGARAWRRPLSEDELEGLVGFVRDALNAGEDFDDGPALALQATLLSPHFLFRVEIDPDPTSETPRALDGWTIASRLSYVLWSSMPDDALLEELFA